MFKVASGSVVVSDPCYDGGEHCVPAKNGRWTAKVEKTDLGSWGNRISKVTVHHEGWSPVGSHLRKKKVEVGVDSGQMGVFDRSVYGGSDDEGFYDSCCNATLGQRGFGFVPGGFVSSSGIGDGCYPAVMWSEGGKVVAVEIEFLTD